jgi:hypothetical protein
MFARLAVADLFIHGIGGAKYDEATDAVCERFFGVAPPAYATLSGTLRLPIAHPPGGAEEVRRLRQLLRDLEFHPERHMAIEEIDENGRQLAGDLVNRKRRWIHETAPADGWARHQGIVEANRGLQALLSRRRASEERRLNQAIERARANRILNSREYAFCLYPRSELEKFLLDFPPGAL